ncbi:hypothetical protein SAMN04488587_1519 [Methanococcoides vulcani]|uniref:Uncharacterized protein n=1 Tax=Methanococcoides vulcani TaxID=1353158 RepID=A0A1I0AA19_9EURY|nr:hypothetical protein SAMN04488587_1519 [Methanococcoides vulcani]
MCFYSTKSRIIVDITSFSLTSCGKSKATALGDNQLIHRNSSRYEIINIGDFTYLYLAYRCYSMVGSTHNSPTYGYAMIFAFNLVL